MSELVCFELEFPAPLYQMLEARAQRMGVSVEELLQALVVCEVKCDLEAVSTD